VEARALALTGVSSVFGAIERVRASANPELHAAGVLVCRMDRTRHAREAREALAGEVDGLLFETSIRESVRLPEAAAAGVPITRYAPASSPAQDYRAAAAELLPRLAIGS
jgi:chromosome partitioning protein